MPTGAAGEPLLCHAAALQRVFQTLVRDHVLLDRTNQRLRRRLHVHVATAYEQRITTGRDRLHRRIGNVCDLAMAFISRSSLRITPGNPSSSRSMPWTMRCDSVAGFSSSSDGTSTCAVSR